MTLLSTNDGLIGDFLGIIPIAQYIAKEEKGLHMIIHPEADKIFKLIPTQYNIERVFHRQYPDDEYSQKLELDISKAFSIASEKNLYMSQAHFEVLGLPVPHVPHKADLFIGTVACPEYDFILAPFARSLPPQEKWEQKKWQRLVDSFPHLRFAMIGTAVHDDPNFLKGYNVTTEFDHDFNFVANMLRECRAVISVVTGISHLCFHLDVPNILINNQNFTWGTNPEATSIRTPIPMLKPDEIGEEMKKYLD